MKILHITKFFYPVKGGIETYTYNLAEYAKREGNKVFVIAAGKINKHERVNGIEVIRLKEKFRIVYTPFVSPFWKDIEKINPDIIHFHMPNPALEFYLLLYMLARRKKLVVTYHADVPYYTALHEVLDAFRSPISEGVLSNADAIISTSSNYASSSPTLRKFTRKISIIPIGIDPLKGFANLKKIKRKYGLGEKVVLFAGRLFPYKGLSFLIEAMKKVSEKHPDAKLVIVGSGELEFELKKLTNHLGLFSNIVFTGELPDRERNALYKLSTVFVLPSVNRGEAFGISMIEAMSVSKPVISTDVKGSGMSFVNKNGETGFVVKSRNSEALAGAINKLLEKEKLRTKFGRNAKKRFYKYFTKEDMGRSVLKIYKKVLSES